MKKMAAKEKVNGKSGCQFGAVLKSDVDHLRGEWRKFIDVTYPESCRDLNATILTLRDKWMGRPSWSVTIILTVLSSVCAALFVKLVK